MLDLIEIVLNKVGSLVIGSVLLEYGASRWQKRPFSRKSLWTIIVLIYGAGIVIKSFLGSVK